ncbi:uncharacterized protein BDW43DRAFT_322038 [Aspergillus alliaceus]|uniref:uncharacterized protein n=1 Tax=Petromyces alliaceus TaxID=209559 RepID=UPI0012A60514|nr:uncharacterized protein BDW43DRAFT_322038 [Aspergillus alliaceus]KAB8229648.1 hypothetical protein BDW43DRAFT_322038 [Aspergillus alliaceus]
MMYYIAVITGGTSGIGLAVAQALVRRLTWRVYILGTNQERGSKAVEGLPGAYFLRSDVRDYHNLADAFHEIYKENGRLDLVFANAGILESCDFHAQHPENRVPPKPDLEVLDVNLVGVVYTSYLALHYFRQSSRNNSEANLVLTGSCLSFYPSTIPLYTAAKHALIGFMRSIGKRCHDEGIRVNALCPGIVQTNLGNADSFRDIPPDIFVPIGEVVRVLLLMVDGPDVTDSKGVQVSGSEFWSRAVEVTRKGYYFREPPEWSDEHMARTMTQSFLQL